MKLDNNLIKTARLIVLILIAIRCGIFLTNFYYNCIKPDLYLENFPDHHHNLLVFNLNGLENQWVRLFIYTVTFIIDTKFLHNIFTIFGIFNKQNVDLKRLVSIEKQTAFLIAITGTVLLDKNTIGLFSPIRLINALLIWGIVKIYELHSQGANI